MRIIKRAQIRNTLYQIDKLTPVECPNNRCNTSCGDIKEFGKHLKYHCRLAIREKEYYLTFPDTGKINRENPKETGLPNCELLIPNCTVKYDPIAKHGITNFVTIKELNTNGWKLPIMQTPNMNLIL